MDLGHRLKSMSTANSVDNYNRTMPLWNWFHNNFDLWFCYAGGMYIRWWLYRCIHLTAFLQRGLVQVKFLLFTHFQYWTRLKRYKKKWSNIEYLWYIQCRHSRSWKNLKIRKQRGKYYALILPFQHIVKQNPHIPNNFHRKLYAYCSPFRSLLKFIHLNSFLFQRKGLLCRQGLSWGVWLCPGRPVPEGTYCVEGPKYYCSFMNN